MSAQSPLFVDTGAFFAAFVADDDNHEPADAVFEGVRSGDLPYGPVFTSRYVLSELATLLVYRVNHAAAVDALSTIRASSTFNVLPVDGDTFDAACEEFERYHDHAISFVDHASGVLAREHDVEHVFAFDGDFRTLGFTLVPADVDATSSGL